MLRTILIPALLATLLAALTTTRADAYGAYHTGYTTVSPAGGVQHYGQTTATGVHGGTYDRTSSTTGGYGAGATHTSSTTATGAYGGVYHGSTTRAYSPATYQGYSAAGMSGSTYRAGVVRYP